MRTLYHLATWRGLPLRLHYTWLSAALLGVAVLMEVTLPSLLPGAGWLERLVYALPIMVGCFCAVLLHEGVQLLLAYACGMPMRAVNLYPLGTLTRLPDRRGDPWVAFWVAAAGPAVSIALWLFLIMMARDPRLDPVLSVVLGSIGQVSLYVGLINLLPGLPLDGGRMLRAVFGLLGGTFERGTAFANRLGLVAAYGLIVWGIAMLLWRRDWLWGGTLLLTGWSLLEAGGAIYRRAVVAELLNRLTAADVVRRPVRTVAPEMTLHVCWDVVQKHPSGSALPVVDDGRFCGMITSDQIRNLPYVFWETRTVAEVMTPSDTLIGVAPGTPVSTLIPRLVTTAQGRPAPLAVVDNGCLIGVIHPEEVGEILELEEEFGVAVCSITPATRVEPAANGAITHQSSSSRPA